MAKYDNPMDRLASALDAYKGVQELVQGDKTRRTAAHDARYAEYKDKVGKTFDNTQLEADRANISQYINDNYYRMDDVSIDNFNSLMDSYDMQKRSNSDYEAKKTQSKAYGDKISSTLDFYSTADSKTSFLVDKETGNIFTGEDPDEYEGELVEYTPEGEHLHSYRKEFKTKIKDDIQSQISSYVQFADGFRASHNDRLSSGTFRRDALLLENINEIYMFGAQQAFDDDLFDEQEKEAYQMAIQSGSLQSVQDYINKETNRDRLVVNKIGGEIDAMYQKGLSYQNILDEQSDYMSLIEEDPDEAAKLGNESFKTHDEVVHQYKDFNDKNSDIHSYIDLYEKELPNMINTIKDKDALLEKRLGGSYLRDINASESETWNAKFSYTPEEKPFTPWVPGTPIPTSPKVEPVEDQAKVDVEEEDKKFTDRPLAWTIPAAALTKMAAPQKFDYIVTSAKDLLKNASLNLHQSFGMGVEQMETFWKSTDAAEKFAKLDVWEKRLKKVSKGSPQWYKIKEQMDKYITRTAKSWAKGDNPKFKQWGWSEKQWKQLLQERGRINFFKTKRFLKNTLSADMFNKIFGKGTGIAKTFVKGVGSRVVPFSIGQTLAEEAGLGKYGQVTGGALTAATIPTAFKWVAKKAAPKLTKILGSDYGRKKLTEFLAKKIGTKVASSIVAGGGVASVLTGIGGTIWAASDVYKFIRDFKE